MSPRALVTGFHDWRTLHPPGNAWWCHENPSGRLLLGAPWSETRPPPPEAAGRGPLPPRLRARRPGVDWSFATLPVRWAVGDALDWSAWDLVVALGLGVYDRPDRLQLERGAINLRGGRPDALGERRAGPIDPGAPDLLPSPGPIDQVLSDMSSQTYAGYVCRVEGARPDNAFICNDTHFRGLQSLARGSARPRAVAFLHIPYPPAEGDAGLAALADGVAALLADFASRLGVGER